jgi:hypothetical protein
MRQLQHGNIEYLIGLVAKAETSAKSFGEVSDFLGGQKSLVVCSSVERDRAFFRLNNNLDYGVSVEAAGGSLDLRSGRVKFAEINYFQKHAIRRDIALFAVPNQLLDPTQSLEKVFLNAKANRLGVDYVVDALQRAGFAYSSGTVRSSRAATMTGDFAMAGQAVAVTVDLREIPLVQPVQFCRDWELQINVKARPDYAPPKPEKKKLNQGAYGSLFVSKAAALTP